MTPVQTGLFEMRPLVAPDDPPNSHEAERIIAPKVTTRKARVLALLREHRGSWVSAVAICAPDVGGSEGLRRVRELRSSGVEIESRPAGKGTSWEYRVPVSDAAE